MKKTPKPAAKAITATATKKPRKPRRSMEAIARDVAHAVMMEFVHKGEDFFAPLGGRPPMKATRSGAVRRPPASKQYKKTVATAVTRATYRKLTEAAARRGMSMSEYMREYVLMPHLDRIP